MRYSIVLVCALLLGGCQNWSSAPEKGSFPAREAGSEDNANEEALAELILYAQRAGQMNAEEEKREVSNLNQALLREKGDKATATRLRLALLLSTPGASVQDDARAQTLLEPYANAGSGANLLRQFGAFLHSQVAERVRGTRRADQLKDQLDALRAVERSIIERGQKPPPRKP